MTRTLWIEIKRGQGWQLRAEGKIPADVTAEQITLELQGYAIQYPRRTLIQWWVVAQAEGDVTRNPYSRDFMGRRRIPIGFYDVRRRFPAEYEEGVPC